MLNAEAKTMEALAAASAQVAEVLEGASKEGKAQHQVHSQPLPGGEIIKENE